MVGANHLINVVPRCLHLHKIEDLQRTSIVVIHVVQGKATTQGPRAGIVLPGGKCFQGPPISVQSPTGTFFNGQVRSQRKKVQGNENN